MYFSVDEKENFDKPSINKSDSEACDKDLLYDTQISVKLGNDINLVDDVEIDTKSQESDNKDQEEIVIPTILVNSLEVIAEEDIQQTR